MLFMSKFSDNYVAVMLSERKLLTLDSIVNNDQWDPSCPFLEIAVYLYLFNLKAVEDSMHSVDAYTESRLVAVLHVNSKRKISSERTRISKKKISKQVAESEPNTVGEELLTLILDSIEDAFLLLTSPAVTFGADDGATTTPFKQYFLLRLALHLGLGCKNVPPSERLDNLDEGLMYCALAFSLRAKNDPHILAAVNKLHAIHRHNGHLIWLQHHIHRTDNHLSMAKSLWLRASDCKSVDHNLTEDRQHLFSDTITLPRPRGFRSLHSVFLSNHPAARYARDNIIESKTVDIKQLLKRIDKASNRIVSQVVAFEKKAHKKLRPYQNLSLDDIDYVSPEDFLQTFVFIFPGVATFDLALGLSGVKQQAYSFQGIAELVSKSLYKLDSAWTQSRDLTIVKKNAEFIRRIWRSYETGVYGLAPTKPIINLCQSLEHWNFVRQVWPQAKRLIVIPSLEFEKAWHQLKLPIDDRTFIYRLDDPKSIKAICSDLQINVNQLSKLRKRFPSLKTKVAFGVDRL